MDQVEGAYTVRDLMPEVYAELRAVAVSYFRAGDRAVTLQPTAVLHEAFLRLAKAEERGGRFRSREHFCAVAATAMRQILVDAARRRRAARRGGDLQKVTLSLAGEADAEFGADLLALDEALRGLAAVSPRQAEIVELRYFGGLTVPETARSLEVSESTVEKEWRRARAFLAAALGTEGGT